MEIRVMDGPLNPWQEIQRHQRRHPELAASSGALVVFVGAMRDHNEGDSVQAMHLEHYPDMTQPHLEEIAARAVAKFDLLDVLLLHRVGEVKPGEEIVLVAVWSTHRKAAYEGNCFIMEDLKSTAPFWKQETLEDGTQRWVECNTPK